ncbi:MAG: hypothetical protein ACJ72W_06660 [Actinoallomurus sp.]
MAKALNTSPQALARMRDNLGLVDEPVAFARRYLRLRGFQRHRCFDDLLEVAVESLVKAGLSWADTGTGVAFSTWAYRYMDREVLREMARDDRRLNERAIPHGEARELDRGEHPWRYRSGLEDYQRVEDRMILEDLYRLARLSPVHIAALEMYGTHTSDGPPPRGQPNLGQLYGSTARTAVRRIRQAITGGAHDDAWARARARARMMGA